MVWKNPILKALGLPTSTSLSLNHIQDLIDLAVRENEQIDFKSDYYTPRGEKNWKAELAKDVAAMANSPTGGVIICGIEESSEHAKGFSNCDLQVTDETRIRNAIYQNIFPEPVVNTRVLADADLSHYVLIIEIPPSEKSPHFVELAGKQHAYQVPTRRGPSTVFLSVDKILRLLEDKGVQQNAAAESQKRQHVEVIDYGNRIFQGPFFCLTAIPMSPRCSRRLEADEVLQAFESVKQTDFMCETLFRQYRVEKMDRIDRGVEISALKQVFPSCLRVYDGGEIHALVGFTMRETNRDDTNSDSDVGVVCSFDIEIALGHALNIIRQMPIKLWGSEEDFQVRVSIVSPTGNPLVIQTLEDRRFRYLRQPEYDYPLPEFRTMDFELRALLSDHEFHKLLVDKAFEAVNQFRVNTLFSIDTSDRDYDSNRE